MNFEDYKNYFGRVQICKYEDDFLFSTVGVPHTVGVFEVNISDSGMHTFSISQKGERMFAKDSGYQYSQGRLTLAKAEGSTFSEGIKFIGGKTSISARDTFLEVTDMEAGLYYLCVEMDWVDDATEDFYNVTCYGASKAHFTNVMHDVDRESFLRAVCESIVNEDGEGIEVEQDEECSEVYKYTVDIDSGYQMYCIKNQHDANTYTESVEYTKFEGLQLLPPEGGNTFDIEVKAGETKVVVMRQSCKGFSMSKSYSS
mmetsp:Transcript_15663/g.24003  ORF Transcript_15663/g.24003 Transcript_15663/m.24003 type:complete len:257 (+) Transcript_15663:912-1682(+)